MDLFFSKMGSINIADLSKAIQDAHAAFGAAILNSWGFTDDFVRIAQMHDEEKFFPTTQKEILIVNLASMITRKIGFSLFSDEGLDLGAIESAQLLGLDGPTLGEVCQGIVQRMQETSNIF